jgi:hypothetical protein
MPDLRDAEIRQNFHYFQQVVPSLMADHAGKYALLHQRTLVDVFSRPVEALEAGHAKFSDGLFSIQKVIDRPLDLGFMSYGSGERTADRG